VPNSYPASNPTRRSAGTTTLSRLASRTCPTRNSTPSRTTTCPPVQTTSGPLASLRVFTAMCASAVLRWLAARTTSFGAKRIARVEQFKARAYDLFTNYLASNTLTNCIGLLAFSFTVTCHTLLAKDCIMASAPVPPPPPLSSIKANNRHGAGFYKLLFLRLLQRYPLDPTGPAYIRYIPFFLPLSPRTRLFRGYGRLFLYITHPRFAGRRRSG